MRLAAQVHQAPAVGTEILQHDMAAGGIGVGIAFEEFLARDDRKLGFLVAGLGGEQRGSSLAAVCAVAHCCVCWRAHQLVRDLVA